jgi:adenylosuccinate lyase
VDRLNSILDPSSFIGRAPHQVESFVAKDVQDALSPWRESLSKGIQKIDLNV